MVQQKTAEKKKIHIVCGPTASGKSSYAMSLAEHQDVVIINADSMQIYDGLHILTAQPPAKDQSQIPHKLYSHLHSNEDASAGNWRGWVEPVIEEVLKDGKMPVIVGGSGLYIKSLIEGLSPIPDIPEDIRAAAVKKQETLGNPGFYETLKERDPVMAERFHPYHTARLIRAWEVLDATGKSLSEWQKIPPSPPPEHWSFTVDIILPERDVLYERCNQRFVQMLKDGALDQIESFSEQIERGQIKTDSLLTKALGFKPLLAYINGDLSKEEAIEKGQAETRQYAKRQTTWFRHQIKPSDSIKTISFKNV